MARSVKDPTKWIVKNCLVCRKPFESYIIKHSEYCSKMCKDKRPYSEEHIRKLADGHRGKFGKNACNWKGGHRMHKGYVIVYCPDHPHRFQRFYVKEHRLVMEKHLGRYLRPEEVVHHKNGIKTDNRIENLELFANHAEHMNAYNHYSKVP